MTTESWLAIVQTGDAEHEQETELVTLEGIEGRVGAVIDLGNGMRIVLDEPGSAAA